MNPMPAGDTSVNVEQLDTVELSALEAGPTNDTWTVRLVVLVLGVFSIGVLAAETVLQIQDRTLPDNIQTLGGVAIGALGAMLASTASKRT